MERLNFYKYIKWGKIIMHSMRLYINKLLEYIYIFRILSRRTKINKYYFKRLQSLKIVIERIPFSILMHQSRKFLLKMTLEDCRVELEKTI